ncbi:MAG: hypothetical protein N2560_03430 [Ignavibacteria bacterium]|nr:hypothetical protein [Ignavibacteria bacterium]
MKRTIATSFLLFLFSFVNSFADWEPLSGISQGQVSDLITFNKKVYAVVWGSGLFVSSDYGDNWIQQNKGITTTFVKCITNVGNVLLVGANDTSGVYRSTDNGYNWIRSVDSLTERSVANFSVDGDVVYLLTESSVIFKSTDFGVSWMQVKTSDLDNFTITAIAVNNGKILAGTSTGDLFLSTNDGKDWTNIKNQQIYSTITCLLWDGENIYCGTTGGIYFSSNYGTNWFQRNLGLKVPDISIIKKVKNAIMLGTRSGGVYFSLDGGRTWFEFNEGITDMSILSIAYDQYYIYIGTEYGSLARRSVNEVKFPEIQAPVLTYPPNGAKGVEKVVNFGWETVKGAIGYHIIVSKDESFSQNSIILDKSGINNNLYPSVYLKPNRKYYWKVAAIDYQYQEKWSEVFSFETIFEALKPTLYFPFHNFETNRLPIQFYWSDVGSLDYYKLEVANSNDFQNLVVNVTTKDTMLTVSEGIENNKTYFWRVTAKYNDTLSVVSDTFSFKTTILGIERDKEKKINWKLVDTKLIFDFENFETERLVTFEIVNIIGQSVVFGWFETASERNMVEIDLYNLPSGIYNFVVKTIDFKVSSMFVLLK